MDDKKELLCPYRAEIFIKSIGEITNTVADLITKHGTHEVTEETTEECVKAFLYCFKEKCAAWNGSYCARIFKGGNS